MQPAFWVAIWEIEDREQVRHPHKNAFGPCPLFVLLSISGCLDLQRPSLFSESPLRGSLATAGDNHLVPPPLTGVDSANAAVRCSARKSCADLLLDTPASPQLETLARALGWQDPQAEAGAGSTLPSASTLLELRKFIRQKGWPEIEQKLISIARGEFLSGVDEGRLQNDAAERSLRKAENARIGRKIIDTLLSDKFAIHLPHGAKERLR
jgi:hypothetical protein